MSSKAVAAGAPVPDKAIGPSQLAMLRIRRVIFHDVPRKVKGKEQAPTLSEVECTIDPGKVGLLKDKLVRVLGSSAAYELDVHPQPESSIPKLVEDTLAGSLTSARFVEVSQAMAVALLGHQPGSASPGLLAVVSCVVSGRAGLALMKLEREEGAQLKLSDRGGKKTFEMDVLADLVLTDGTNCSSPRCLRARGRGLMTLRRSRAMGSGRIRGPMSSRSSGFGSWDASCGRRRGSRPRNSLR